MPRAVMKDGVICLLEPLPTDWVNGRELSVDLAEEDDEALDLDDWFKELNSLVAQNDLSDLADVEKAIQIADDQAKMLVHKQMGLP